MIARAREIGGLDSYRTEGNDLVGLWIPVGIGITARSGGGTPASADRGSEESAARSKSGKLNLARIYTEAMKKTCAKFEALHPFAKVEPSA